ncbi:tetratricopeptide repeat protein 37 [Sitophilus oryzae]|uniref:Tetratricopeptide repeat protein 37 n=1 Tax=Sitophilus oryzae TaxID=7048 RepID=A0A6J2YIT8_SITOR|nr:tetratricopeptide repeat protein 37 [Sitophilus oryzae]
MKDIKVLLKETREAIAKKDFQNALKLSKTILKEDKSNYMAMVFLGFSLQEVGPIEQTPKAFQKAINLAPTNPLAWQGLINYYEKIEQEDAKTELIKTILSYLDVESNESKLEKYCTKLVDIRSFGDILDICNALYQACQKCEDEIKLSIINKIKVILEDETKNSDPNYLILYEKYIPELILNGCISEKCFSNFLAILYKEKSYIKTLDTAIEMNKLYPTNIVSFYWICKIYNQLWIEENPDVNKYEDKIEEYVENVLKLEQDNSMGLFTSAIFSLKTNKYLEAKEKLFKVTNKSPGLIYAWFLYTEVLIYLEYFEEALNSLERTKKLSQKMENSLISQNIPAQEVKVLSMSNDLSDWEQAADLFSSEGFVKEKCLFYVADICINLERYSEASLYISEFKDEEKYNLLKIKLLVKQEKYPEALKLFEKLNFNSAEWWMELGKLYWKLEEYQKSLEPFLKAAKSNPDNYKCFFWLGNVYNQFNQLDKSRRCFEKAFSIYPSSLQTSCELSKVYRKLKNWDANLQLLLSISQDVINKKNLWAWLQLGLTYFEQGDILNSIKYLRTVVRYNPESAHCWESLADAYFTRGSFTSALKCYEKASSLSEDTLYSTLQIAYIKKILKEYPEAKVEFENILKVNREYVPALKGLAETALCQARAFFKEERLEAALECAQLVTNKISLAILQRSELSCLWKIFGDCVYFVAKLPEKYCCLNISKEFLEQESTGYGRYLEKDELFNFATKCFCKAVSLAEDNPYLWHDLAVCYLEHARQVSEENVKEKLTNYSIQAAQKAADLDTTNWQHWNLLGCIHFFKGSSTGMIQHYFIKAVTVDHNSAISWTNLGVLYLLKGDIKLANKAFAEGQRTDPDYVNSWIGQALIAENLKHKDTMGLFRHSVKLRHHDQGCLGYANTVCDALINRPLKDRTFHYLIYDMHAIPVACDAIQWYIEKHPEDGCAWNLFGILLERMGLKYSARDAFEKAFRYSGKEDREKARINFGRLLYHTGNLPKSIEMFHDADEASFSSGSGLALALYKSGHFEESYAVYEQALHWLTDKQTNQSDVLVALASMAYKFQGPEAAKTLLFQSIELKPPSPWSLFATFSLALLHNDDKLAQLVCKELADVEKHLEEVEMEQTEFVYHYATLLAYYYIITDNKKKAIVELSKLVHKYPNESSTWLTLSMTIFRLQTAKKALEIAARCAQTAIKLGRTNTNVCKVLYLVALSFYMAGDSKKALIYAQKAVHATPNSSEAWAMLTRLLTSRKNDLPENYFIKVMDLLDSAQKSNNVLVTWFNKLKIVT